MLTPLVLLYHRSRMEWGSSPPETRAGNTCACTHTRDSGTLAGSTRKSLRASGSSEPFTPCGSGSLLCVDTDGGSKGNEEGEMSHTAMVMAEGGE